MEKKQGDIQILNMIRLKLVVIVTLFSLNYGNSQQIKGLNKIYFDIDGKNGVIFLNKGDFGLKNFNPERTYISVKEVICIDSLAKSYVTEKSKGKLPQQGFDNCPIIYKNWEQYSRQIMSYKEEISGDTIVWIQYIHKQELIDHKHWKDNWVLTSGGCSNYWQISYNKNAKKFFDFVIN